MFLSLVLMVMCLSVTVTSTCENLSGHWKNELGSTMLLSHVNDQLGGFYWTAVESHPGDAGGNQTHPIQGKVLKHTVSFEVGWTASMAAWIGQCHVVDGKDTMFTSWILKSEAETLDDEWMSKRIGEDKFTRYGN